MLMFLIINVLASVRITTSPKFLIFSSGRLLIHHVSQTWIGTLGTAIASATWAQFNIVHKSLVLCETLADTVVLSAKSSLWVSVSRATWWRSIYALNKLWKFEASQQINEHADFVLILIRCIVVRSVTRLQVLPLAESLDRNTCTACM